MTGNFLNNPVMKYLNFKAKGNFKNSNYIDKNGFFVGNYPRDIRKQIKFLHKKINEALKMKSILITGSSGMVGKSLIKNLKNKYKVLQFKRA